MKYVFILTFALAPFISNGQEMFRDTFPILFAYESEEGEIKWKKGFLEQTGTVTVNRFRINADGKPCREKEVERQRVYAISPIFRVRVYAKPEDKVLTWVPIRGVQ